MSTSDTSTTGVVTSGDTGSSTSLDPSDTSDPTLSIEPSAVLLFASNVQSGAFAMESTVAEAGGAACFDAADEAGFVLECLWLVPIIATSEVGFPDLPDGHPGLDEAPLLSLDGDPLADSYEGLVDGVVAETFEDAVTDLIGGANDPSFWWGPREAGEPHCSGWTTTAGNGQALTFDSASSLTLPSANPCNQQRHLLCACAVE